jgi:hypothetical protein
MDTWICGYVDIQICGFVDGNYVPETFQSKALVLGEDPPGINF